MSFGKGRVRPLSPKSAPAHGDSSNRRWSERRSIRVPAVIMPGGSSTSIACTIADMSTTGAKLVMSPGWINPFGRHSGAGQQFTLFMRMDRMQVSCEIIRLEGDEMGVRFVGPPQPMTRRI